MAIPSIPVGLEVEAEMLRLEGEHYPWEPRARPPVSEAMKPHVETDAEHLARERKRIASRLKEIGRHQLGIKGEKGPLPTMLEMAWWEWNEERMVRERKERVEKKKRAEEKKAECGRKKKKTEEKATQSDSGDEDIVELKEESNPLTTTATDDDLTPSNP